MKRFLISLFAIVFVFSAVLVAVPSEAQAKRSKAVECRSNKSKLSKEEKKIAAFDLETQTELDRILSNPSGQFAGGVQQDYARYYKQRKTERKDFVKKTEQRIKLLKSKVKRYCK